MNQRVTVLLLTWGLLTCGCPIYLNAQENTSGWGTIRGQVIYGGEKIPTREKLKVDKDQEHCLAKGDLYDEKWLINPSNKGVKNVFVWLIQADPDSDQPLPIHPQLKEIPKQPVVIDQPYCQFIPHALVMRQGQTLLAKNSAAVPHNIDLIGSPKYGNTTWNFILPPGGERAIKDLKAQRLPLFLKCDIHGWMNARIGVYDHPYFALTDAEGKFEIKLAPAGNYRLMIWHEAVGYLGGVKGRNGYPITIRAEAVTDLGQYKIQENN